MKELIIEVLLTIQGIAAASGIVYQDKKIVIVSDNSILLYRYDMKAQQLAKDTLIWNDIAENVPKKQKADFEAITQTKGVFYVFGSGSGARRNSLITYNPERNAKDSIDLKPVYENLMQKFGISDKDFNIEGAVSMGNEWWLFNRGNGPNKKNGVFILEKRTFRPKDFFAVSLPTLQAVETGFTDATLVDGKIYFTAAAEDSNSSYHDGEIKGTLIGRLDPKTRKLEYTQTLSEKNKFEGISLFRKSKHRLEFLLCEDEDADVSASKIYKVTIPR
ncbi:DUF6929 family protein [Sphingobacterium griseoflavum]|uniref:Uncharacterized protein n=1 Tax=Sphingobacterium griseoflavum TaxID=1474952 RepID=A0ABQ3HS59_9SPHI|nr:hypothetical protein [Sphingobacterium griseoflavum]GHE29282.1 hypothetical protein GCM10017764_10040 [Sphingobacterium griseoflavum]